MKGNKIHHLTPTVFEVGLRDQPMMRLYCDIMLKVVL